MTHKQLKIGQEVSRLSIETAEILVLHIYSLFRDPVVLKHTTILAKTIL